MGLDNGRRMTILINIVIGVELAGYAASRPGVGPDVDRIVQGSTSKGQGASPHHACRAALFLAAGDASLV
jgi:hypothetical protein